MSTWKRRRTEVVIRSGSHQGWVAVRKKLNCSVTFGCVLRNLCDQCYFGCPRYLSR